MQCKPTCTLNIWSRSSLILWTKNDCEFTFLCTQFYQWVWQLIIYGLHVHVCELLYQTWIMITWKTKSERANLTNSRIKLAFQSTCTECVWINIWINKDISVKVYVCTCTYSTSVLHVVVPVSYPGVEKQQGHRSSVFRHCLGFQVM